MVGFEQTIVQFTIGPGLCSTNVPLVMALLRNFFGVIFCIFLKFTMNVSLLYCLRKQFYSILCYV